MLESSKSNLTSTSMSSPCSGADPGLFIMRVGVKKILRGRHIEIFLAVWWRELSVSCRKISQILACSYYSFDKQGQETLLCFCRFHKSVWLYRDILWYKLIKCGVSGKFLNVIISMYEHVKSRVKLENVLSNNFECFLGIRQGECLSLFFLFSMYVNDLEEEFRLNGLDGVDIGYLKLLLLLYANDITLFSETEEGLQNGINILNVYCNRWKLKVGS